MHEKFRSPADASDSAPSGAPSSGPVYQELRAALDATSKRTEEPLDGESLAKRKRVCHAKLRNVMTVLKAFAYTAADLVGSPLAKIPVLRIRVWIAPRICDPAFRPVPSGRGAWFGS